MDPSQVDALVQRLVADPHDEDVLASAHQAGASDPKAYAQLLERVATETKDPAYAAHWFSEAAHVWSSTLGDVHRAARALMQAIDRDPTQSTAAGRLAQLYRDKSDFKALVALLERRAKALAPMAADSDEIREELAGMHEELGRLWQENLKQPKKALENFRRSIELDPSGAYAIYNAREIYKSLGQWAEANKMYEAELAIERDPERVIALLRDEAATRKGAGDLAGASGALVRARQHDADDAGLKQEFASSILERMVAGESVPPEERASAAELLSGLAEEYGGQHGLAYSAGALDIEPGNDRALQLYAHYAHELEREEDIGARYLAYIQASPDGALAADARWLVAASYEAAAQLENAISILEPLRALGHDGAAEKLADLYGRAGKRMPSVPPPPSAQPGAGGSVRPGPSPDKLAALLDAAKGLADAGKRPEACEKYREVLKGDPANPEALSWVEDYLRTKRDFAALRDVLLAAVRAPGESNDSRKGRLREVANLCEGNLRDVDGAIGAYKQLLSLDRADESAHQALTRILEKAQRWDDLANLLEQEATAEDDLEKKIALEKKVAAHHELKRRDFGAAAEAWERIANLAPDDDHALSTASKLFEKAGAVDRAAQVIAGGASGVSDATARSALLDRLGALREKLGDLEGAGEAYAGASSESKSAKLQGAAERCFVAALRWDRAGEIAVQLAEATEEGPQKQATHFARAGEHFGNAGDETGALTNLERAASLDPANDDYLRALTERYTEAGRFEDLAALLVKRAEHASDKTKRVEIRRQIASLFATLLGNKDAAREAWRKVLEDGEDAEALDRLVDDAVEREDYAEATVLLRRRRDAASEPAEKTRISLREAALLAEGLDDVKAAVAAYEKVLTDLDPACRPALQAIADLEEAADNPRAAADALERELELAVDPGDRASIASRLARLYGQLDNPASAIRALEVVRLADPDDFDALTRLCDLCEKTESWAKVAELLAQRVEIEADDSEMSALTRRLSSVLADKLDRGDEALATLSELADQGDESVREAYEKLGDKLGWRGIVATKLVEWWSDAKPGPERTAHLRGAFERFAEVGRDEDAVRVGCEVVRSKGADRQLAAELEAVASKTKDLDALSMAHDFIARELSGTERARELVRQAEARVAAGGPRPDALQHGEGGLAAVPPGEVEDLMVRLAAIAETPDQVVDLYERQVSRCKAPADRASALAKAAQVAASRGRVERARVFFDLVLSASPTDEIVTDLEQSARAADSEVGGDTLRRTLCASMAAGGQGARDGGRTRGSLLRRAAAIANDDLKDIEQAFTWLGDALVAHVEAPTLDALKSLAREVKDMRREEATLSRALGEVFDGPLVRQLLARRAKLRREDLDDKPGAATDLKKLYDLSPHDQSLLVELSALLGELGDHRAIVQLYEDQILRGKDMNARVDLARQIARIWEEELVDPREAADAWRRVLRMKQGDPAATAGLERAKSNMLRKADRPSESLMASNLTSAKHDLEAEEESPPAPRVEAKVKAKAAAEEDAFHDEEQAPSTPSPAEVEAVEAAETAADTEPPTAEEAAPAGDSEPSPAGASTADEDEPAQPTEGVSAEFADETAVGDPGAAEPTIQTAPPPSSHPTAEALDAAAAAEDVFVVEESLSVEVVLAEDVEEISEEIEIMEIAEAPAASDEKPKPPPKRSVPPPLPRA